MLDKNILLENCKTDIQIENVTAYFEHCMSYTAAAKALGKTPKAVEKGVKLGAGMAVGFTAISIGFGLAAGIIGLAYQKATGE